MNINNNTLRYKINKQETYTLHKKFTVENPYGEKLANNGSII